MVASSVPPVHPPNAGILPVMVKMKDGSTTTGKLNIGDYPRVSDFFQAIPGPVLRPVSEVEHRGLSGKVVIINRSEIIWTEPEDA